MSPAPYTSEEHAQSLRVWMTQATDHQRSEAFYRLHSHVGADAMLGNDHRARILRELLAEVTS